MNLPWYIYVLIVGLLIMNIVGLILMYIDKKRAIRHEWRIREVTLFLVALVGGSLGSIIGMYAFRHKTKHWYFVVGMPLILIAQIALGIFLCHLAGLF